MIPSAAGQIGKELMQVPLALALAGFRYLKYAKYYEQSASF